MVIQSMKTYFWVKFVNEAKTDYLEFLEELNNQQERFSNANDPEISNTVNYLENLFELLSMNEEYIDLNKMKKVIVDFDLPLNAEVRLIYKGVFLPNRQEG